ncbi:MAG TPA: heat-inducible transcriptional repressor HrcA [Coriobacteriia bacterium]|nr:heat-inducible transcriptional repressor HrcA [Coriobacteriia bacterium]
MSSLLNDRRRRVLTALVEEYIASATPVGSKTLVDRYELGCSPATVRNELAILEETGFVVQPHVSAGRLPTDTGYRDFVDHLLEDEFNVAFEPARLNTNGEIDDLMRETSALLTRLTDSLAVVLAPSVSRVRVRRIDLLSMAPRRALFVLITESGQVLNRNVVLDEDTMPERLSQVERALNAALVNKRAADIRPLYAALLEGTIDDPLFDAVVALVVGEILEVLDEADKDRLYHVGVPALLAQPEFHDAERARPLIECVEDGIALLDAMSDAAGVAGVGVRIGHENRRVELGSVSIVVTDYGTGGSEGIVGVIGPTRMNYQRAITAVRAVADGLSEALA